MVLMPHELSKYVCQNLVLMKIWLCSGWAVVIDSLFNYHGRWIGGGFFVGWITPNTDTQSLTWEKLKRSLLKLSSVWLAMIWLTSCLSSNFSDILDMSLHFLFVFSCWDFIPSMQVADSIESSESLSPSLLHFSPQNPAGTPQWQPLAQSFFLSLGLPSFLPLPKNLTMCLPSGKLIASIFSLHQSTCKCLDLLDLQKALL